MKKTPEMIRWTLEWSNPRTAPPDGQPRVLVEQILPRGQEPTEINARLVLGSGYGSHFRIHNPPPLRQLSLEAKQRIRRKAVARRIEKAAPLFADTLIEATVNAQPDYYGPDALTIDQEKKQ